MTRYRWSQMLTLAGVAAVLLTGMSFVAAQKESAAPKKGERRSGQPGTSAAGQNQSTDIKIPDAEKPFWESAQVFVDAYAQRDAKALGDLFTEDAEFYDEFGERTEGREAIVEMFQGVFDSGSESLIEEIIIEQVRPITDNVALEEGETIASDTPGGPRYHNRYVALHVKGDDGVWRINTLKDRPREAGSRHEQLEQLAWLLGEWVNEDRESVVHTECDWSEDGNYLLRRFTVQTHDGREMNGVQRMGWDAKLKVLRSWTFDSEGGFLTGEWARSGNQWLLTNTGVNAEGKSVSGTAVYTVIDAEMLTWQLQNIVIGDDVTAAGPLVTMVRRPPEPNTTADK